MRIAIIGADAMGQVLGAGWSKVGHNVKFGVPDPKVALWTQKGLDAARHLYEASGFRLVREEPHHSWSKDHIGQYWELIL